MFGVFLFQNNCIFVTNTESYSTLLKGNEGHLNGKNKHSGLLITEN